MKRWKALSETCSNQHTLSVSAGNVQGTRGLMVSSIVLCFISILVAVMGMKCTTAMSDSPDLKDKVALSGGIVLIIAGES